jgi:predicted AAA+ superfamily ATPase
MNSGNCCHFSMPVGRVEYLSMEPMTFTEYLQALGERKLLGEINNYQLGSTIDPVIHQRLLKLLRGYFFVGGMPEAVDVFVTTGRLREVSDVHRAIIETYRDDFPKYCGSRNLSRMLQVFNFIAKQVGKKVKYSTISTHDQSATIKRDIELLTMARLVTKVVHSHCSGLPLQVDSKASVYKLIFRDVGLMNAICGLGWPSLSQLPNDRLINEGAIAEQFIGQHLVALLADRPNRELTYWLREGKSANAEVDFVVSFDGLIVPIEVKAGASGSLKSLHQFVGEKQVPYAVRFDSGLPTTQTVGTVIRRATKTQDVRYQLLSLPLYLVERLPDLVRQLAVMDNILHYECW